MQGLFALNLASLYPEVLQKISNFQPIGSFYGKVMEKFHLCLWLRQATKFQNSIIVLMNMQHWDGAI